jgi:hypothetical protein
MFQEEIFPADLEKNRNMKFACKFTTQSPLTSPDRLPTADVMDGARQNTTQKKTTIYEPSDSLQKTPLLEGVCWNIISTIKCKLEILNRAWKGCPCGLSAQCMRMKQDTLRSLRTMAQKLPVKKLDIEAFNVDCSSYEQSNSFALFICFDVDFSQFDFVLDGLGLSNQTSSLEQPIAFGLGCLFPRIFPGDDCFNITQNN